MSVSDVHLSWTTMGGLCKVCVLDGVRGRFEGRRTRRGAVAVEWLQPKEEFYTKKALLARFVNMTCFAHETHACWVVYTL